MQAKAPKVPRTRLPERIAMPKCATAAFAASLPCVAVEEEGEVEVDAGNNQRPRVPLNPLKKNPQ